MGSMHHLNFFFKSGKIRYFSIAVCSNWLTLGDGPKWTLEELQFLAVFTRMAFQLCRMSHCDLSVLIYKCVHEHYEDSGCCGSFQKHLHTVCLVHSLQEATVRLLCLLFPAYLLKAASLVGVSFLPAVFCGTVLQLSVSASSWTLTLLLSSRPTLPPFISVRSWSCPSLMHRLCYDIGEGKISSM